MADLRAVVCAIVVTSFLALPGSPARAQNAGPRALPNATPPVDVPPPVEPFRLTPPQQQALDQVLGQWEKRAQRIRTFKCKLLRWEENNVFNTKVFTEGELRYKNPDQALYRVKPTEEEEWAEYWVCDGQAIFEFNHQQKELVERRLPPEMQGKAIEDGPLPFLFSTSAAKLKQRYYLRLLAPPANRPGEIWLEAFPRYRQDAANFKRAELIIDQESMLPSAIRIHLPNGQDRTIHQFKDIVTNDPLGFLKGDFAAPRAPRGWQHRVEMAEPLALDEPLPQVPAHGPRQASAGGRPPVQEPRR